MPKQSVFDMPFEKIYSLLTAKAERKGRTKAEVGDVSYGEFLSNAPECNPRS